MSNLTVAFIIYIVVMLLLAYDMRKQ